MTGWRPCCRCTTRASRDTIPARRWRELGLPAELYNDRAFEWYDRLNILKGGIAFADIVITVSPTHARELCTPTGGFGLHDTFIALGDRLQGILNGIDLETWNPETDPHIAANYSADDLRGSGAARPRCSAPTTCRRSPRSPCSG